jgi:uncharacterized protein (DUF1778 family)
MPDRRNSVVTVKTSGRLLPYCLAALLAAGIGAPLADRVSASQAKQAAPVAPGQPGQTRQGPRPERGPMEAWPWWKDDDIVKELGLTADKVRKIDGIYARRQRTMQTFVDEFEKQRSLLDQMTRERIVDAESYQLQVSKFEMLRTKLFESRTVMLYQLRLELAPPQYQKFLEILDRRFRPRPERGPLDAFAWWKDEAIIKELALTPDKVRRMDGIYSRRQRNLQTFVAEYHGQRDLLDRMTRERIVDAETYQLQVSKFEMLRSKIYEGRTVMLYQLRLELSPQQYQKFVEIQDRRSNRGRGGS